MSNQQAPQQPNEPNNQSWLRRQWANLRDGRWRDVIIADVGEGSENVAVGKNIFQINVGGRNITPYLLVIMLAALVLVVIFVYPSIEPLWNPTKMGGDTNIAVADFGLMNENGAIKRSDFGGTLSESVFNQLLDEYQLVEAEGGLDGNVAIWHDSQTHEKKNVRFGVIRGDTPEARSSSAAKLAKRINADMIIYGHLTDQENPEGLVLEFYYASPTISSEPDAIVGNHRLGRAVPARLSLFNVDPTVAKAEARQPLADRTSAIFYLTLGLTQGLANNHEEALATFQRAESDLDGWKDDDGKAVLYYFMGRSALFARRHDVAIDALEKALALNPTYVNALITLGAVYIDKAQLFFVRDRELPSEIAQCIPEHRIRVQFTHVGRRNRRHRNRSGLSGTGRRTGPRHTDAAAEADGPDDSCHRSQSARAGGHLCQRFAHGAAVCRRGAGRLRRHCRAACRGRSASFCGLDPSGEWRRPCAGWPPERRCRRRCNQCRGRRSLSP